MVSIREVLDVLEEFAPLALQESFDNTGIQVGEIGQEVKGVLLCVDVTEDVMDEALVKGCNLVIAHHPLLFKPVKSLRGTTYVERCVMKACKYDMVIYAAHTNLDNLRKGINGWLGKRIGLDNVHILSPKREGLVKVVTFVPSGHVQKVQDALFATGAGCVGNYDRCSFRHEGLGSFRAQEGAHPFLGKVGKEHVEREERIETVVPVHLQEKILQAVYAAHPYEEPVTDLYPLNNAWEEVGSGIWGDLSAEEDEREFLLRVKELFKIRCIKHSTLRGKPVRRVAVCGGSGAFLIKEAIACGADVLLTGEARYNDYHDVQNRLLLAVTGHYESEACTKDIFRTLLSEKFPTFALHLSEADVNPVKYL
ncbi:MAG: Nif3-like dinuclear metal center hexameric protein [Tannerellaceae bacterium]|jgi:dinuclear metal center YbgI/SA1388 family protein|nr:Nif3-like dinuclear metal center hexameric protein [Tannerellaceae bacterium]